MSVSDEAHRQWISEAALSRCPVQAIVGLPDLEQDAAISPLSRMSCEEPECLCRTHQLIRFLEGEVELELRSAYPIDRASATIVNDHIMLQYRNAASGDDAEPSCALLLWWSYKIRRA